MQLLAAPARYRSCCTAFQSLSAPHIPQDDMPLHACKHAACQTATLSCAQCREPCAAEAGGQCRGGGLQRSTRRRSRAPDPEFASAAPAAARPPVCSAALLPAGGARALALLNPRSIVVPCGHSTCIDTPTTLIGCSAPSCLMILIRNIY